MDNTLQEIITLVEKGKVEQRCAALLVLGALKITNAAVVKAVGALLNDPNPVLKDYALRYFEEVQPKNNVAQLVRMLDDDDRELQERAVRSFGGAGQAGVEPVMAALPSLSRVGQLNAARVLCQLGGKAALKGLLEILASGNDEINRAVCDLLIPVLREMNARDQDAFYESLESFAGKLDLKEQRPALIAALRLFAQLGRPQTRRSQHCQNRLQRLGISLQGLFCQVQMFGAGDG